MNLVQLQCLVAIADADLRLDLAAIHAGVSQRALLGHIKQIEQELGLNLVLRRGRALEALTRTGAGVVRRARTVLDGVASIRDSGAYEDAGQAGALVIAATHTQARYLLPAPLAALRRLYPRLSLVLQEPVPRRKGRVAGLRADLIIHSTSGEAPVAEIAIPIYRWKRSLVVLPGHPLARLGRPPTLSDLIEHPLIGHASANRVPSFLQRAYQGHALQPQLSISTPNADLVKAYVRNGAGVGILPQVTIVESDDDLLQLPAPEQIDGGTTWMIVPGDRPLRDCVESLVHLLAPHLSTTALSARLRGTRIGKSPEIPDWEPPKADEGSGAGLGDSPGRHRLEAPSGVSC